MNNFKSFLIITLTVSLSLSSCMTTRTTVGTYQDEPGTEYTFDKGKQFWLFWGIIPIGRTDIDTPTDGDCEVITKFKLVDIIISGVTFGIITSYSIKVKAKEKTE